MNLDPKTTALLTLDLQYGILGMAQGTETAVANAAKAVEAGRKKGFKIIHVGLGFNEGHPELPEREGMFAMVKKNNYFVKGSESAKFHPSILHGDDLIIYKQRVSAFTQNNLDMVLRAGGYQNLILMGVATSGIVLSTLREAFDKDYACTVIKDACFDRDEEVHRMLTEKILKVQGQVVTTEEFIK